MSLLQLFLLSEKLTKSLINLFILPPGIFLLSTSLKYFQETLILCGTLVAVSVIIHHRTIHNLLSVVLLSRKIHFRTC